MLKPTAMLLACCYDVDARGVDARVSEDVRKLGNVVLESVKGACK